VWGLRSGGGRQPDGAEQAPHPGSPRGRPRFHFLVRLETGAAVLATDGL
jgi:hypothetical protein